MNSIEGHWHDFGSSACVSARLEVWPTMNLAHLAGEGCARDYPLDTVRISTRVGNIPRRLEWADGSCFETSDNEAVDALFDRAASRERLAHWLESHWGWALAALLFTTALVWSAVALGIPYLAERVAYAIPMEMETGMGEQSLQALDKLAFTPSQLPSPQQERGRQLLRSLAGEAQRLEFRAMGEIPNAFALPSGIIVITDRLMKLAVSDDELLAVLGHELGHVHYRHSLRTWLQNSATALLTAAVLGDVNSISANVVVLPTVLLQSRYSRVFEEQADDHAAQLLQARGIRPCKLGAILKKMEDAMKGRGGDTPDFLSTHPATEKRIQRLGGDCL